MKDLPRRKRLRLKGFDYSQNGAYFITICVKDRHEMLGKIVGRDVNIAPHIQLSNYGVIVEKHIQKINSLQNGVMIDKYVIMPNHIHIIAVVNCRYLSHGNRGTTQASNGTMEASYGTMKTSNGTMKTSNGTVKTSYGTMKTSCPTVRTSYGTVKTSYGTMKTSCPTDALIPKILRSFKTMVTKEIGFSLWQTSYHDHIIRTEDEYRKIWEYIDENPARWKDDRYFDKYEHP